MIHFESARLRFREIAEGDITVDMIANLNDPDINQYSNNRFTIHTIESQLTFLRGIRDSGNYYIGGFDEEGRLVATLTIYLNRNHNVADIGIMLQKDFVGRGYGHESYEATVDYCMNILGLRKITGGTLANNSAMARIFKRLGFTLEGKRLQQEMYQEHYVDQLLFGLIRKKSDDV